MENFDGDFGAPAPADDVDPAAEFLAKEQVIWIKWIVRVQKHYLFQEELGEIGEDLGLAPPQEISVFKEESDFSSNGMQVRISFLNKFW